MRKILFALLALFAVAVCAAPIGMNLGSFTISAPSQPFIDLTMVAKVHSYRVPFHGFISALNAPGTSGNILTVTSVDGNNGILGNTTDNTFYIVGPNVPANTYVTGTYNFPISTGPGIDNYQLSNSAAIGSATAPVQMYWVVQNEWFTANSSGGNTNESVWLQLDANGWPNSFTAITGEPGGQSFTHVALPYFVNVPPDPINGQYYRSGQYVVMYDGATTAGIVTYNGDVSSSQHNVGTACNGQPNRDIITINTPTAVGFSIVINSVPSSTTYIRNIHVVQLINESRFCAGQVYDPVFLAKLKNVTGLRFMDWKHTNSAAVSDWSYRPLPTQGGFGGYFGIADELIARLCNDTKATCWVPSGSFLDDNGIAQEAQLFHDKLNPGIEMILEYSNEIPWNSAAGFYQSGWLGIQSTTQFQGQFLGYISNGTSGTAGTVLTVTSMVSGQVGPKYNLACYNASTNTSSMVASTYVTAYGTGHGGAGTYTVNSSQALGTSGSPVTCYAAAGAGISVALGYVDDGSNGSGPSGIAGNVLHLQTPIVGSFCAVGSGQGEGTADTCSTGTLKGQYGVSVPSLWGSSLVQTSATQGYGGYQVGPNILVDNLSGTPGSAGSTYRINPSQNSGAASIIVSINPNYSAAVDYAGYRSARICDIWKSVWGADGNRLHCGVGGQNATGITLMSDKMNCTRWATGAPCGNHGIDYGHIAPYYNANLSNSNPTITGTVSGSGSSGVLTLTAACPSTTPQLANGMVLGFGSNGVATVTGNSTATASNGSTYATPTSGTACASSAAYAINITTAATCTACAVSGVTDMGYFVNQPDGGISIWGKWLTVGSVLASGDPGTGGIVQANALAPVAGIISDMASKGWGNVLINSYEGGQQFYSNNLGSYPSGCAPYCAKVQTLINAVDNNAVSYTATLALLNGWKSYAGTGTFYYFVLEGESQTTSSSFGGYFGLIPSYVSTWYPLSSAPQRWQAVQNWVTTTPCYFIGCKGY